MNHSTLAKNAWLFLEFYLLVEEDYFSLFQLQLEISELKEKMKHLEHQELQKMDNGPSQQMIEELLQKLSSLERDLEVEKGEKESIIHEIVNLQEVLKKKEEEKKRKSNQSNSTKTRNATLSKLQQWTPIFTATMCINSSLAKEPEKCSISQFHYRQECFISK